MKTRDMAYISISAALIALCAWLSVPAAIPFTMQTFAVFAAAGTLGARRGAAALGLYILLGALGLPVFSGFQGGVGALLDGANLNAGERDPMFAEEAQHPTRPPEMDLEEAPPEHPTLDDYVPEVETPVDKTADELIREAEAAQADT